MKGFISLEQELRSIRKKPGPEKGGGAKAPRAAAETARPWQPDIDRVQQTMRELLWAIAGLAGVELPAVPGGLQIDGAPPPRLDVKTLKDRIRNDLEGFSIKTTADVAKQAEEQTRAALDAIRNEAGERLEQFAAEFREKLQQRLAPEPMEMDPAQIDSFLEPRLKQVVAGLESSLEQKVEQLAAEQQPLLHEKFQGALNSLQTRMTALEQAMQQVCKLKAELLGEFRLERPDLAAEDANKDSGIGLDKGAGGSPGEAAAGREPPLKNFPASSPKEAGQVARAEAEKQRKDAVADTTDIHSRLKRAGELLAGLESEKLRRRPG